MHLWVSYRASVEGAKVLGVLQGLGCSIVGLRFRASWCGLLVVISRAEVGDAAPRHNP